MYLRSPFFVLLLRSARYVYAAAEKFEISNANDYASYHREGMYADRFVKGTIDTWNDPECMSGTLDAASPDFSYSDAIRIFSKCRLLHIENFYSQDMLREYKKKVTSYLTGIASGRISDKGKTTLAGEPYYFAENAHHRFDICFTEDMLNEEIMASELLIDILQDRRVLDDDIQMLDFGVILSEPGAPVQRWHRDGGSYLFPKSYTMGGVGGHDLPPFAVAAITPMLDLEANHGPTEFCMGNTHWVGIDDTQDLGKLPLKDDSLRPTLQEIASYQDHYNEQESYYGCPAKAWRSPQLKFGDLLLFDYNMLHRGGPNESDSARTMIYNTYVRSWYKDPNFSQPEKAPHSKEEKSIIDTFSEELKELIQNVRIAIPDEVRPEDAETKANNENFDTLEQIKTFRPSRFAYQEGDESEEDSEDDEDGEAGQEEYDYQFLISNYDIEGIRICDKEGCDPIPAGTDQVVWADAKDVILIKDENDKVLKKYNIGNYGQEQIILKKDYLGLAERKAS